MMIATGCSKCSPISQIQRDIIPDELPGIGFLDDAIMIDLAAIDLTPELEAYAEFCDNRDDLAAKEADAQPLKVARDELQSRMRRRRRRRAGGAARGDRHYHVHLPSRLRTKIQDMKKAPEVSCLRGFVCDLSPYSYPSRRDIRACRSARLSGAADYKPSSYGRRSLGPRTRSKSRGL